MWFQFEKLLCVSEKYERHIQYHDTCYLNFNYAGQGPVVIELNDPGIEHTGAREMAIRKADAVILNYAMYSAHSFHQLTAIAEDFKQRKNGSYVCATGAPILIEIMESGRFQPPVLLICNEDEVYIEEERRCDELLSKGERPCAEDLLPTNFPAVEEAQCPLPSPAVSTPNHHTSTANAASSHQSSTSEGYESLPDDPEDDDETPDEAAHATDGDLSTARVHSPGTRMNRRESMEAIRRSRDAEEACPISKEQGETMAKLFGPHCEHISIRVNSYSYEDAGKLMESLIARIKNHVEGGGSPTGEGSRTARKEKRRSPTLIKSIRRRGSIPLPFHLGAHIGSGRKSEPATEQKRSMKEVKSGASKGRSPKGSVDSGGTTGRPKRDASASSSGSSSTSDAQNNTSRSSGKSGKGVSGALRKMSTVLTSRRSKSMNPNPRVDNWMTKEEAAAVADLVKRASPPLQAEESCRGDQGKLGGSTWERLKEMAAPAESTCNSRKHSFRVEVPEAKDKKSPAVNNAHASNVCVIS